MRTLFCIALVMLLAGCGEVAGYAIANAIKLCESHGGIYALYSNMGGTNARCGDGKIFYDADRYSKNMETN